jgi:hypothetical protein
MAKLVHAPDAFAEPTEVRRNGEAGELHPHPSSNGPARPAASCVTVAALPMTSRTSGATTACRRGRRIRAVAVAVVVALGLPAGGPALVRADGNTDGRVQAKALVVEGARLLRRGEAQTALQRFQSAYDLYPSPKIHFDFGLAYKTLGRPVEAVQAFQKFLADASDADREERMQAWRMLDELMRRVVSLELTCSESGAEIFLDGHPRGRTPRSEPLVLEPGVHELVVKAPGTDFLPYSQSLTAEAGKKVLVSIHLVHAPGRVPALPEPVPTAEPVALRPEVITAPPARPTPAVPAYKRWWFWAGVGVLAGAVATTAVLVSRDRRTSCTGPLCSGVEP